jgi:L-rhamnonate dehydratase
MAYAAAVPVLFVTFQAAAYDIPVIPHGGDAFDSIHFILATPKSSWAETFMPPPGGPEEVYRRFEEDNHLARGPEGIYARARRTWLLPMRG